VPKENNDSARLHADDVRESYKLGFESVKQVTTLTAGSFLLSATFLNTIFPQNAVADLESDEKILIGGAFLCFALSLVFSTFSMWRIAAMVRSRREYYRKKFKIGWNIVLPSFFYILGLSLFGTAVLSSVLNISDDKVLASARTDPKTLISINLVEKNLPALPWTDSLQLTPEFILYSLVAIFILGVASWFGLRLVKGYRRDRAVQYVIVYPSAADLDELHQEAVQRESPVPVQVELLRVPDGVSIETKEQS
jgi:hypothetical protein